MFRLQCSTARVAQYLLEVGHEKSFAVLHGYRVILHVIFLFRFYWLIVSMMKVKTHRTLCHIQSSVFRYGFQSCRGWHFHLVPLMQILVSLIEKKKRGYFDKTQFHFRVVWSKTGLVWNFAWSMSSHQSLLQQSI